MAKNVSVVDGVNVIEVDVPSWAAPTDTFARVRQEYDRASGESLDRLTVEQVRIAMNVWLAVANLPAAVRRECFQAEIDKQQYCQHRNQQTLTSHAKTRIRRLTVLGIDVAKIKSCIREEQPP